MQARRDDSILLFGNVAGWGIAGDVVIFKDVVDGIAWIGPVSYTNAVATIAASSSRLASVRYPDSSSARYTGNRGRHVPVFAHRIKTDVKVGIGCVRGWGRKLHAISCRGQRDCRECHGIPCSLGCRCSPPNLHSYTPQSATRQYLRCNELAAPSVADVHWATGANYGYRDKRGDHRQHSVSELLVTHAQVPQQEKPISSFRTASSCPSESDRASVVNEMSKTFSIGLYLGEQ